MKDFFRHITQKHYPSPGSQEVGRAFWSFSTPEKLVFYALTAILAVSAFGLLYRASEAFMVTVPGKGGELVEGIVGYPRFINPLLATTEADKDLSSLLFTGLMRSNAEGVLEPDLASGYEVSENGLIYTVNLKEASFHDGHPVTADDVIFTVSKAQDEAVQSSRRANWIGVVAEKVDEHTVRFTLSQPYAPFIENLTLGILPKHLWESIPADQFAASELNTAPVGSGPYRMKKVGKDDSGIPQYYELASFDTYTNGAPFISKFIFRFYPNEDRAFEAYKSGDIDSLAAPSPQIAEEIESRTGSTLTRLPLSRVFGVFFNQNHNQLFTDAAVRKALSDTVPREKIVEDVLLGYGTAITGPFPPSFETGTSTSASSTPDRETIIAAAKEELIAADWEWNADQKIWEKESGGETVSLTFSLTTSDAPELKETAELLKAAWAEIGIPVDIKVFEVGNLNQLVIRPRKYDALLFGQVVGRDLDLFAFWHSSQRNDPGLNINLYANPTVDDLLERARTTRDLGERKLLGSQIAEELIQDTPAAFIYSPDFIYVLPKKVKGVPRRTIATPADRLALVNEWYIETEHIWKIFIK